MPSELPRRASSTHQTVVSPRPQPIPRPFPVDFEQDQDGGKNGDNHDDDSIEESTSPPPSLLSPAFTPPSTPGSETPLRSQRSKSIPVDSSTSSGPAPRLLGVLPEVECVVRARIPTINGQEMFLHLYTNNVDNKEHLAIVFGPQIRSRSLDRERPGETEMDRMIRGAYTGRLFPGRMSSKVEPGKSKIEPTPAQRSPDHSDISHTTDLSDPAQPNPSASNHTSPPILASLEDRSASPTAFGTTIHNPPLVRIHSECYTGETVWSARCDCGEQLDEAARLMSMPAADETSIPTSITTTTTSPAAAALPSGVIIYLRQEGRGIGLSEKLKAYNLQDLGSDTVEANILLRHPADARSYGLATSMLVDLGLGGDTGIRLMTNNPDKIRAVEGPGREVRVRERVAMVPLAWKTGGKAGVRSVEVESYLKTKIEQFGHMIGYAQ